MRDRLLPLPRVPTRPRLVRRPRISMPNLRPLRPRIEPIDRPLPLIEPIDRPGPGRFDEPPKALPCPNPPNRLPWPPMPCPGPLPPPGLPGPCLLCPNRLRICAILLKICPNWGCEPCALFPRCCPKPNPRIGPCGATFWASNASPPNKRTAITAHKAIFLTILHPFQTKPFFPFSYPVLQTTRRAQ